MGPKAKGYSDMQNDLGIHCPDIPGNVGPFGSLFFISPYHLTNTVNVYKSIRFRHHFERETNKQTGSCLYGK